MDWWIGGLVVMMILIMINDNDEISMQRKRPEYREKPEYRRAQLETLR